MELLLLLKILINFTHLIFLYLHIAAITLLFIFLTKKTSNNVEFFAIFVKFMKDKKIIYNEHLCCCLKNYYTHGYG